MLNKVNHRFYNSTLKYFIHVCHYESPVQKTFSFGLDTKKELTEFHYSHLSWFRPCSKKSVDNFMASIDSSKMEWSVTVIINRFGKVLGPCHISQDL